MDSIPVKRHGDMEMEMPHGIPWLMYPLVFHSSREHGCDFDKETCNWLYGYWLNWYKDDLRYALPTVALFMSIILVFVIGNFTNQSMSRRALQSKPIRRLTGIIRYLSYRAFRIPKLNWNSAPAGVLMLGGVGAIYFFSMTLGPKPYYWPNTATVNYGNSPAIATRSGWLSIACMPFVFATAGKSNFITMVTGISHEKLQVFHRWISYAFFVTALVHTFPFIVYHIKVGDMTMQWKTDAFYWTGVAALVPQGYLTFASFSPLRNLSYEWFKATHFLAATCFVAFFFLHCAGTLTSWDYFVVTGVLFSLSWLHRQVRIYFEHGTSHRATLNLEPNGFIQVVVPTEAKWRAGQHFFVRFLSLGLHAWTIHPFTVCSLPQRSSVFEATDSELVFYIRPQRGFTGRLARYIETHPGCTMRVLLDGPYGGIDMTKLERSQRQLVVAGGSGAGWILPLLTAHMRRLELARLADLSEKGQITSKPSMRILLATRDVFTRDWFEEKVLDLLESFELDKSIPGLEVELYVTGSGDHGEASKADGQFLQRLEEPEKVSDAEVHASEPQSSSASSSGRLSNKLVNVHYHGGRPNLPEIIRRESQSTDSEMPLGVFVCGPLSMQSDVSNAVAAEQVSIIKDGSRDIYLHMEHFSWA